MEAVALNPDDNGKQWFVVYCYSGYENKVRHAIEQRIEMMGMQDKIFDVVVPTEEEIQVKDGKRKTIKGRVFPGYLLVEMKADEDSWNTIRNTPGVTGFVDMNHAPKRLHPEEFKKIGRKASFEPGQLVRIIHGPFRDFIGSVGDIDVGKAIVWVMVSFFGRETPVELDFLQVEKA